MGRTTAFIEALEGRLLLTAEAIWIEGESVASSTFNQHSWYRDSSIDKSLLSGRNWHVHYSTSSSTATATYNVNVQHGGTYWWWLRLNPHRNNYSVSIDGSAYAPLDVSAVASKQDLVDPGIDIRFIGWAFGGKTNLTPGPHTVRIRVSATGETHGGIDAMAFTNYPWAPTGIIPPNPNAPAPSPEDWFMFAAGPDEFSSESIIDMSHLLEETAGSHGYLRRQGDGFVFEDGTPAKFWAIGAGMASSVAAQQQQARFYAKHGVNMVRHHPVQNVLGLLVTDPATGERQFDPAKLDRWDRWFSILRENGIYMTWSMFYPHVITSADGYPTDLYNELPNASGGKSTSGMVSFMPQLQQAQWEWVRRLLEHVNPYTGLAYKDDPALAIIEVHNEDSIFWHAPLNDLAAGTKYPLHTAQLKLRWQQWVKVRYGNDTNLRNAWGQGFLSGDSVSNTNMKIYGAWEMGADGPPSWAAREKARMGDFIRFLAEMQADFYAQRQQQLRDVGYKAVTVSTAWMAGGPAATAANLWTDDVMEAIDRHAYFGGSEGNWQIVTTDANSNGKPGEVSNASHLGSPGGGLLAPGMLQVEDKPFIMTEWSQQPPNQWKAEASPLLAFYGMGLQGWDAIYHFTGSRSYYGNGWPDLSSFVSETPHYMGQFPALAFAIHHGHFAEGDAAAARRLSVNDIFKGHDALGAINTPAAAMAVGRVSTKVADDQAPSHAANLGDWWDQPGQVVRSNTGQLTWDYGRRIVTAHTDKTQAVIGFAGGYSFDLPGVSVEVVTPFVSLIFTPLDNRPLIHSEHILITAMARDQNYGAEYSVDGTQLLKAGMEPLMMEPVRAAITLKGQPIESIRVVDVYGVPTSWQVDRAGNTFSIDGRYATYYYEVRRGPAEQINGTSGDDAIRIARDPADPAMIKVSRGAATYTLSLAGLSELRINGAGGMDRIEIDLAHGNPIPAGGLRLANGSFAFNASADATALSLFVDPGATAVLEGLRRLGILEIAPGAWARIEAGAGAVLRLDDLRLIGTGTLDLADNALVINAGADQAGMLARIRSAISTARNATPLWSGPGLTTSAATDLTGLGVFPGENDILVQHVLTGDIDGDGRVTAADYFRMDHAFLAGGELADIDFNGRADGDDYFLLDRAYLNQSAIPAAATTAAPQPLPPTFSTSPITAAAEDAHDIPAEPHIPFARQASSPATPYPLPCLPDWHPLTVPTVGMFEEEHELLHPDVGVAVYEVRGETIAIDVPRLVCLTCGEAMVDDAFGDPLLHIYAEYRRRHGLLSPGQIRAIREKYDLSQDAFAALLGTSPATFARYEGGSIQDKAYDQLIRACENPAYVADLVEREGHHLSSRQLQGVKAALARLRVPQAIVSAFPDLRWLKWAAYAAVVVWFCRRLRSVPQTKMCKLLFYSDFLSFQRWGRPLTGIVYKRLPYGPVPSEYELLRGLLEEEDQIVVAEVVYPPGYVGLELRPGPAAMQPESVLSVDDLRILGFVAAEFGQMTAKEISDRSHQEPAWIETPPRAVISYDYAAQLSVRLPE